MKKLDQRIEFFNVDETDEEALEAVPWGTEHQLIGYNPTNFWQSTPNFWRFVLGSPMDFGVLRNLILTVLHEYMGPAYHFLLVYQETGDGKIQAAMLKTESGADDLLQCSNVRAPMWWTHPPEPKPKLPPNRYQALMGEDLY